MSASEREQVDADEWFDPANTLASIRDHVQSVHPGLVLHARLTYGSVTIEYAGDDKRKLMLYGSGGGYYDTRFVSVGEATRVITAGLADGAALKRVDTTSGDDW